MRAFSCRVFHRRRDTGWAMVVSDEQRCFLVPQTFLTTGRCCRNEVPTRFRSGLGMRDPPSDGCYRSSSNLPRIPFFLAGRQFRTTQVLAEAARVRRNQETTWESGNGEYSNVRLFDRGSDGVQARRCLEQGGVSSYRWSSLAEQEARNTYGLPRDTRKPNKST